MRWLGWIAIMAVGWGCANKATCALEEPSEDPETPNILLVVIDDAGIDQYAQWDASSVPVPAPAMDCLCSTGLRFDTVWASPFCTPARAALLTGLHPRREGIGRFNNVDNSTWELPLPQRTLAEALREEGYRTAFFGKWHLGAKTAPSAQEHPNLQGFHHFAGTFGNIRPAEGQRRGNYFRWEHLENGEFSSRRGYLTSATVDDALDGIEALPEPWFVVVSFNGVHVPFHRPPGRLVDGRVPRNATEREEHRAMVEATDTELGRLLEEIEPGVLARTQIWTMADNGSVEEGRPPDDPINRHKGSLYEAGVRVPMVVSGAGVTHRGESTEALVSILDVFPTVLEQVGGDIGEIDGWSLMPVLENPDADHRDVLYADVTHHDDTVWRAVRNRQQKLILRDDGTTETWRLLDGLDEEPVPFNNPTLEQAMEDFIAAFSPEAGEPGTQ
ncbi:MAG: sulfatase-like hydrolase/transferase [Myxococcota bacterium]